MNLRKAFLTLHLVGGLVSGLTLLGLGISGGMLVFEKEIDHWLNRRLTAVQPAGTPRPLSELCSATERRHEGAKATGIILPVEDASAFNVNVRFDGGRKAASFAVNQYTGEELGPMAEASQFTRLLHQFHTNLLLGPIGKTVTTVSAMFLCALALSGLVLWWPRKIWKPGMAGAGQGWSFAWHNLLGLYASAFLLLFGLTGIVIHWDNEIKAAINRWSGSAGEAPVARASSPASGAARLNVDQVFAIACEAVPGARVTSLQGLGGSAPIRATMRYPEDRTPLGRTNLFIDPASGKIVSMETSRTGPIGMRIAKLWNREIHTGDIGGWPTRLVACLASLALPVLAITGPIIWVGRWRRRSRHGAAAAGEW